MEVRQFERIGGVFQITYNSRLLANWGIRDNKLVNLLGKTCM